jgi:hypothetical protein
VPAFGTGESAWATDGADSTDAAMTAVIAAPRAEDAHALGVIPSVSPCFVP